MQFREGGALACHDILKTRLIDHDHVDLAFTHDGFSCFGDRALGAVKAKEHLALAEERRFRGIEILRSLGLGIQNASAKGDHVPIVAADGKHQPVAETRVGSAAARFFIALYKEARLHQYALGDLGLRGPLAEESAVARRVAHLPVLRHLRLDAPRLEVVTRGRGDLVLHQQLVKPFGNLPVRTQQQAAVLGLRLRIGVPDFLLNADARRIRQAFDRFDE